jgi:hypothetical protein
MVADHFLILILEYNLWDYKKHNKNPKQDFGKSCNRDFAVFLQKAGLHLNSFQFTQLLTTRTIKHSDM